MDATKLKADIRDIYGKKVKTLREAGQIPVVLYGQGKNQSLSVNEKEFTKLFKTAGSSTLIDVEVDSGKPVKVLIHGFQMNPVSGRLVHADLYEVKLDEKIQTDIALSFIGESPAVTDLEGNLVTTKDSLRVEAFPQDLIAEIEVDISSLATFDDKITVSDIKVPSTITVLDDPEETLAVVTPPRSEEELEAELAPTTEEQEAAAIAATEEASTEKPEGEAPGENEGEEETTENKQEG